MDAGEHFSNWSTNAAAAELSPAFIERVAELDSWLKPHFGALAKKLSTVELWLHHLCDESRSASKVDVAYLGYLWFSPEDPAHNTQLSKTLAAWVLPMSRTYYRWAAYYLATAAGLYAIAGTTDDTEMASALERPYLTIQRYIELLVDHPELEELIGSLEHWSGGPETLDALVRGCWTLPRQSQSRAR